MNIRTHIKTLLFAGTSFVLPFVTFAQGGVNTSVIKQYSDAIIGVINVVLVPVLVAIAFIVFLWGVYKYYILNADNEAERAKGHQFMLWGIIGFVIIMSVWAIVNFVMSIFGLTSTQSPTIPTIGGGK